MSVSTEVPNCPATSRLLPASEMACRKSRKEYDDKKAALEADIEQMKLNELLAVNEHEAVLAEVNRCNDGLEKGKNELIALLQERGSIQSRQHFLHPCNY